MVYYRHTRYARRFERTDGHIDKEDTVMVKLTGRNVRYALTSLAAAALLSIGALTATGPTPTVDTREAPMARTAAGRQGPERHKILPPGAPELAARPCRITRTCVQPRL